MIAGGVNGVWFRYSMRPSIIRLKQNHPAFLHHMGHLQSEIVYLSSVQLHF